MIAERTKALLSAAAAIYGASWVEGHYTRSGDDWVDGDHSMTADAAVESAYALLDAIEAREKENYQTREAE